MVGPQLQTTPDEQTFIKILNSIDDQTKEITKYPSHPNEKIQEEYVILDGQNYAFEQNLENNIRKHVDVLERRYAHCKKFFKINIKGTTIRTSLKSKRFNLPYFNARRRRIYERS